ncbi:MAG TPA: M48 family peptidase [bacterium]|nr:M48 family peptidase [bacterium]
MFIPNESLFMPQIIIDKIVRSKRKTVVLTITEDAELIVHAPMRTSLHYIHGLVTKNLPWIEKKKAAVNKLNMDYKPKEFVDGEEFLYLGNVYTLKLSDQKQIELNDHLIFPRAYLPRAKEKLKEWYRAQALPVISKRVAYYSLMTGCKYKSVKISTAKKRWGSCGPSGTLNFSWRLIMTPAEIVDYLVVHEVSHIKHRNHSAEYWNMVKTILPYYKEHNKWLRENGRLLGL